MADPHEEGAPRGWAPEAGEPPAEPMEEERFEELPPDAPRKDRLGTSMRVLLGIDLVLLGFVFLNQMVSGIAIAFFPDSGLAERIVEAGRNAGPATFWLNAAGVLLLMGALPLAFGFFTRVQPLEGGIRYFQLRGPWQEPLLGVAWGFLLVLGVVALQSAWICATEGCDALTSNETASADSPTIEGLLSSLSWPLAIAIAVSAGVGEEILFRGVLQKHLGVWGQGVLFGATHAGYGTLPQLVIPFGIGLLFGYWVKRGRTLWMPIAAHFTFDFLQLAGILLAP